MQRAGDAQWLRAQQVAVLADRGDQFVCGAPDAVWGRLLAADFVHEWQGVKEHACVLARAVTAREQRLAEQRGWGEACLGRGSFDCFCHLVRETRHDAWFLSCDRFEDFFFSVGSVALFTLSHEPKRPRCEILMGN
eukprot:TRINITY_DN4691_c0_g2_i2.p3 TRINITY_DN4691_c0_g2~~TRINITY_DN4691_c0_g2_i2.p3  ORF type:complete len:136 (+),score=43.52 TRINITY_DN4691_c0_g2_i2:168-575(+)